MKSPQEKDDVFLEFFDKWCEEYTQNIFSIVMGDFNFNVMKPSPNCKKLISIANQNELKQIITEPTRETSKSKTIIDLVFTNSDEIEIEIDNKDNISDHNIIFLRLNKDKNQPKNMNNVTKINWKNYSSEKLLNEINNIDWTCFERIS